MLKNLNNFMRNRIGYTSDSSFVSIIVDAIDKSGISESDKVVGRESGAIWIVCKLFDKVKRCAVCGDSTDGLFLTT